MKKLKLFIAALALLGGGNFANAQTDVTSTYLTNAGFETDGSKDATTIPTGWTLASSSGSYTSYRPINATSTPNGSKTVSNGSATGAAEGSCYLYLRTNWGSGAIDLTQVTSETLPVGHYVLKADILQPYTTTGMPTFTLSAKNGNTSLASVSITNEAPIWKTFSVEFDLSEATSITVGLYHATGTGNSAGCLSLVDNIRLIQYNYSTLQALISDAETLYDESGTDASTFSSAITTAKAITSSDPTATVTSAIEALEGAIDTYKTAQFVAPDDTNYSSWITNNTLDTTTGGTVFDTQGTVWNSNIPSGWSVARNSSGGMNTTTVTSGQSGSGFETWTGSSTAFITLYQSISSLPAGQYTLSAYMQNGGKIFVQNGDNEPIYSPECTGSSWTQYSVSFIKENTDDVILIGTIPSSSSSSVWGQYDEFSLTCNGIDPSPLKAQIASLQAEAVAYLENAEYTNVTGVERTELTTQSTTTAASNTETAYNTLITKVQSAIDAFTAAKTNYDALVAEIAKAKALGIADATADGYAATSESTAATALASTQSLKMVEYNFVTTEYQYGVELGTWTTTGPTGSLSDQHYKGSGNSYLEQSNAAWSQNSWTIQYSQDLALPAGKYVFKVAGRQADSDGVTLSLDVKNGETSLGTVSDFPRGDTGLGINTSGATDFTTGEGHEYVNGGAGRGWEWRYVKFELDEDATVNIAVNAVATTNHMWVSFCDATVQTDNETNISLIAYNIALNDAKTAKNNSDYANVTGEELTALNAAIAADETLDKTDKTAIEAATTTLNDAVAAFTAAKSAYDGFVAAKATEYTDDQPYASATKFAAIATAQGASATSAADAITKTNAILSAYRKYVESNALAEGVEGAENKTDLISDPNMEVTYNSTAHTFGAWQVFGQTDGTISLKTENDQPLTDSEGNKYKYADIWKTDNNGGIKQTINLPAGKYLLTAAARAQDTQDAIFGLFADNARTEILRINNTGGVFGNGWNDAYVEFFVPTTSDVEIGVQSGNGKTMWWGATRFRLVKLPTPEVTISESDDSAPTAQALANVTLTRTLSSSYWNTFSVPFNMAKPEGWTVKEFDSATDNVINFKDATTIVAGVPYLVKPTSNVENPTFEGVTVENTEGETMGTGDYKFAAQIYNKSLATDGTIAYLATDGYIKKLNSATGLKGLRAYFIIPAGSNPVGARIAFIDGDQTGINDTVREATNDNRVYDLQGRQVKAVKKGIYVVNGKKVIK